MIHTPAAFMIPFNYISIIPHIQFSIFYFIVFIYKKFCFSFSILLEGAFVILCIYCAYIKSLLLFLGGTDLISIPSAISSLTLAAMVSVRMATLRWLWPPKPLSTTKAWSNGSLLPFTNLLARLMLSISHLMNRHVSWNSVAGRTMASR